MATAPISGAASLILRLALLAGSIALCAAAGTAVVEVNKTLTPTGQQLQPVARVLTLDSHPLDLALSSGGELALKTSHGLTFVDSRSGRVEQTLALPHDRVDYPRNLGGNGLVGIAWTADGNRVWSADGFGVLRSATRGASRRYQWDSSIAIPGPSGYFRDPKTNELDPSVPTGIALSRDGTLVFLACSRNDTVAVVDARRRVVIASIPVGSSPFSLLRHDETLYVTNLGGRHPLPGEAVADSGGDRIRVDARGIAGAGSVSVIDLRTRRVVRTVETGRHPEAMALSPDANRLYVLDANDDAMTVIGTGANAIVKTVRLPLQSGFGANSNALAVSRDGRLYVAEGADNRVLVLDGSSYRALGQIASGWYPVAVAIGSDGTAFVASLQGWGSRGLDFGFERADLGFRLDVPLGRHGYNVYDYTGTLQIVPASPELAPPQPSSAAFRGGNTVSDPEYLAASTVPVPIRPGQMSLFKHVVFIIKENHTYDDYFGDVADGNGDPRFCAFPLRVSPNHHALARRFGLLDSFYVNGTMSGDGHQWTDEGGTTDYVERNTASWAKSYPSDGTDPLAFMASGFIWQRVLDSGRTFRDYGEFVVSEPATSPANATWQRFYTDRQRGTHRASFRNVIAIRSLATYVDMAYPAFTLRISDQARADEFVREVKRFERRGALPSFLLVQLGNDHTAGSFPGYPVPASAVADNDLALGRIVDALSHSRYWTSTVIFVVEDDAQNGIDHVDGHRTMALAISAYNRERTVDSTYYDQTSILRTIEAIFGLRPLTQFDASSPAIVDLFGLQPHSRPYAALPNRVPLDTLNPKRVGLRGPAASDFDRPDVVDPSFFIARGEPPQ